ncbi:hypothetical protein ACWDA3_55575 [Nonomuraea rubra]
MSKPPKIGTYPGLNGGYTIEHPGAAQARPGQLPASQIPCTCPLVEFTVRLPAYEITAMEKLAAHENTTVDDMVHGRLKGFGGAYPLNQDPACQDPCTYIR